MRLLITGCAGFIGYHLAEAQLSHDVEVIGVDNYSDYYDVQLKHDRIERLKRHKHYKFIKQDISDVVGLFELFKSYKPTHVVNLAAQPGVRYSIENPAAYVQANVVGFSNIIEACRQFHVEHLVYASTSSVYGANASLPYREQDGTNHPLSIYAASKKSNELIAHSYSHLFALPTTGLRFFTVYGPWGRPDMAFFSFTRNILAGKPIKIFNHGKMQRDFTYVDDIVRGISAVIEKKPKPNPNWDAKNPKPDSSHSPYTIYNIGHGVSVQLMDYIHALEKALGREAIKEFHPMQDGDVLATHADTSKLKNNLNYQPDTDITTGINQFVDWYRTYYKV
tara:strand:+ start:1267 stop:2274 length:1008 start_codon:yes stop_codon:yes gene_type:complete